MSEDRDIVDDADSAYDISRRCALSSALSAIDTSARGGHTFAALAISVCHFRHVERSLVAQGYRFKSDYELTSDGQRVKAIVQWAPPVDRSSEPWTDDPERWARWIVDYYDQPTASDAKRSLKRDEDRLLDAMVEIGKPTTIGDLRATVRMQGRRVSALVAGFVASGEIVPTENRLIALDPAVMVARRAEMAAKASRSVGDTKKGPI
jgi:hypothetical protein